MVLNARLGRVLREVRRWRGTREVTSIPVHRDLPSADWRHLSAEIEATITARGGPVAARKRAGTIGLTYEQLSELGKRRFFENLAADFGHDDAQVDQAMDAVFRAKDPLARRKAEVELRARLRPQREVLLRRLAGLDGGLPFLISLRADLLPLRRESLQLAALDHDLRQILAEWFDVGLLRLERLTWDTPASFLEKLIEYEAVHAIESWDDLKHRLGPGRRCYAFVHPGMPDDPLIFVEVALTKDIARSLGPLLDAEARSQAEQADEDEADFNTAIFYSISNCHLGLSGVSLGDFLIKSVVEELSTELANLKTFATLSPVPGFRDWLSTKLEDPVAASELGPLEPSGSPATPDTAEDAQQSVSSAAALAELVDGPPRQPDDALVTAYRPTLLRLVAKYLTEVDRSGRSADPVAHFHLSNGARLEQVNWMANPNPVGWDRGLAMMVNYRYELRAIERNYESYVNEQQVAVSETVKKLVAEPKS